MQPEAEQVDEVASSAKNPAAATASASPGRGEIANLTPMLRHYLQVKEEHPDAIVLYRMGDFFELFFEDAEIAAPILEVQLTARQRGTPSEAPMCGVPHHSVEGYIAKLLGAGLKVAVCDQVEDPAQAKGLVRREVTRIVTPGTVSDIGLLDSRRANYLACVLWRAERGAIGCLDVSTGAFFVRDQLGTEELIEELARSRPTEVLVQAGMLPEEVSSWIEGHVACRTTFSADELESAEAAESRLRRQLEVGTLRSFGLEPGALACRAAARLLEYASSSLRATLDHVRTLEVRGPEQVLVLDETTLRNLEIFESARERSREGTLLASVDRTVTAPGARCLREWLTAPLRSERRIRERLDAVASLVESTSVRRDARRHLARIADLERLTARAVIGNLTPPEAAAVRNSLGEVPALFASLSTLSARRLRKLSQLDPLSDLQELLATELVAEPPLSFKDGGVIAEGVDAELDRLRSLALDARQHLLELEAREREATGIGSLKVRFNRVFGYYIEVTKANRHLAPEHYIRKQTLANAERFFTEELKALEEQILGAEERLSSLEEELFARLRLRLANQASRLRTLASAVAQIDVLAGFAEVAARFDYCRPEIEAGGELQITNGRHAVIEQTSASPFVPNDATLGGDSQIVLLTGPNMGGKSTYLRQVALIVLLAHSGSFVPAAAASMPLVDRIFTRVGASDNLVRGESTFMVEMIETANILRYATADSLVVLDEVGRGTATYDGLSLAWAIVEHLHQETGALTLFATHYHELTELAQTLPRVRNRTMSVKEWHDQIVFLHRVEAGSADKSYGLQVARLAGVPAPVIDRAAEILANLEGQEHDDLGRPRWSLGEHAPPPDEGGAQLTLFTRPEEVVASVIRELAIERLTPLAALNLLQTLRARLVGEETPDDDTSAMS